MCHRFFETDVIRPFLFIHGQEAVTKQISQVSDVYVNFYLQSDFDHIHDVLPNFIYGYPPN